MPHPEAEMEATQQLGYLAAGAFDLVATWDAVAHEFGRQTLPASACASEAKRLPPQVDGPEPVELAEPVTHARADQWIRGR